MISNDPLWPLNLRPNNCENSVQNRKEHFENVKNLMHQILLKIPESSSNIKSNKTVLRTCFDSWKNFVNHKKRRMKYEQETAAQREKLNNFLKKIKKIKHNQGQNKSAHASENRKNETKHKKTLQLNENRRNTFNNLEKEKQTNDSDSSLKIDQKLITQEFGTIYKHRFQAQQNVINMQKMKLERQNKLIEDLKLGKISVDLSTSLATTRNEIQEIFRKSSPQVKSKVIPLIDEKSLIFELRSEKVPRIVLQMEKRAQERAFRRQIILERKKLIDQEKKRIAELILKQKHMQDEEEKKRALEAMQEKRRKDLQIQKVRQQNKEKYFNNLKRAMDFEEKRLKMLGIRCFVLLIDVKNKNYEKSDQFCRRSIRKKYFIKWVAYYNELQKKHFERAESHYHNRLLVKYTNLFKKVILQKQQSMQVATDLYNLKLQINFVYYWHLYTCKQYMIEFKNTEKADKHYKRRLLWQCFFQWRKLPAVLQLEKAKEEKLKKWREKVWDIISDYKPECLD